MFPIWSIQNVDRRRKERSIGLGREVDVEDTGMRGLMNLIAGRVVRTLKVRFC
jgi:hypothetical protein